MKSKLLSCFLVLFSKKERSDTNHCLMVFFHLFNSFMSIRSHVSSLGRKIWGKGAAILPQSQRSRKFKTARNKKEVQRRNERERAKRCDQKAKQNSSKDQYSNRKRRLVWWHTMLGVTHIETRIKRTKNRKTRGKNKSLTSPYETSNRKRREYH